MYRILFEHSVLSFAFSIFNNASTGVLIGERDIDTLLEPTSDSIIQLPWHVCCAEEKDTAHISSDPLHSHKEFSFNSSSRIVLAFGSAAAQGVNLIDEENAGIFVPSYFEELLNKTFGLSHPFTDEIRTGY